MATKRTDNDLLTETNIQKVISLLEPEDGSKSKTTKKDACQILGIAYNTTRLATIIDKYKEKKAKDAERRSALRGKPASQDEINFTIQEYMEGNTVDSISKSLYRSAGFVTTLLERYEVPKRASSQDYFRPELIPEGAMRTRFSVGETVYSARYDSLARIDSEQSDPRYGWIYRIWLLSDKWLQSAYQEACELASLDHLRTLGVKI
jgi:hypothetical protein